MTEWIRRGRRTAASVRLFCFPQAGGGASHFARWQREASADLEICAVQLPGREDRIRESPPGNVSALLSALTAELSPYFDKPYALYGHSFGARLAFELARYLRMAALPGPIHLFVSGSAPPDAPPPARLGELSDEEFLAKVSLLYQGIPSAVLAEPELLRVLVPALKADFRIMEAMEYRPEPPLDIPISAFGGRSDHAVSERDLAGWSSHTKRRFRLEMFDGDHFLLRTSAESVLRSITRELEFRFSAGY
jgi:medium-chain acyl-[acyl-carrier-protein] hydrolase